MTAAWFANPHSRGSAHLCVDDRECYRTLENWQIPWGAPGANRHGFHIEQAGFARWSAAIWKTHLATLRRGAYKAALHCHAFGIPPRFVTAGGLRAGTKGITTHAECTKAAARKFGAELPPYRPAPCGVSQWGSSPGERPLA